MNKHFIDELCLSTMVFLFHCKRLQHDRSSDKATRRVQVTYWRKHAKCTNASAQHNNSEMTTT
jgi:hypothetical protein